MTQPPNTIICFMCKGFVSYKDNNPSKFNKHMNSEHMAFFGLEYLLAGCTMSEDERFAVRDVIKDRIEPNNDVGSKETTLEEEAMEDSDEKEKNNTPSRHQCPHCNISYTFKVDLTSHIESKHSKSSRSDRESIHKNKTLSSGKKCGPNLGQKLSKEEAWKMTTETRRKDLTSTSKAVDITRKDNKKEIASPIKKVIPKETDSSKDTLKLDTEEPAPLNVLKKKILLAKSSKVTSDKTILVDKSNTPNKAIADENEDPGSGTVCPSCNKEFKLNTHMRFHFKDIHQPGHFPCTGENCGKVFTSKNKMSSHRSRHCNPNKTQKRRTL